MSPLLTLPLLLLPWAQLEHGRAPLAQRSTLPPANFSEIPKDAAGLPGGRQLEQGILSGRGSAADSDHHYIALLVEFEADVTTTTTGEGLFQRDARWPDHVPHDSAYFRRQLDHLEAYWETVSGGRAGLSVDLDSRMHALPAPMARYGADDESTRRTAELLRDSILAADEGLDYSLYRGVIVIHAGAGQESDLDLDSEDDIWSSYLSAADLEEELGLPQGIETRDGVAFRQGIVVPEMEIQDAEDEDPAKILAVLGVLAFETGHYLGLPDLFDTGTGLQDSWGIGSWGVMGLGAWNGNGFVPPHPCAWSKMKLGWTTDLAVASGDTLSLAPVEGSPAPIMKVQAAPNELFLASYRVGDQNGNGCFDFVDADDDSLFNYFDPLSGDSYLGAEFDYYLPTGPGTRCDGSTAGLLFWHIDEEVIATQGDLDINLVNANANRKGVDLEEASGIQNLDQYPGSWGDADDFWPVGTRFGPDSHPDTGTNKGAATGWAFAVLASDGEAATIAVSIERAQEGFPIELGTGLVGDVLVDDFDLDGAADVVVANAAGEVHLLWGEAQGGPSRAEADAVAGGVAGLAAADLDGDRAPDLVVLSGHGAASALKVADNAIGYERRLPAPIPLGAPWGQTLGEGFRTGPALADLDADGQVEIVLFPLADATRCDLVVLSASGEILVREALAGVVRAPPALSQDGRIVCVAEGQLLSWRWQGGGLSDSRTLAIAGNVSSGLLAIDMDGDDLEETLVIQEEGRADLVDAELRFLPAWPVVVNEGLGSPAAVADLGGDERIDLVALSFGPTAIQRWDRSGDGVLDWRNPSLDEGGSDLIIVRAGPLVADLDGNGVEDLIVALPTGIIRGIDPGTSGVEADTPEGFPLQASGPLSFSPAIADLDGDLDLELVVAEDEGRIMAWDFPGRGVPRWAQAAGGSARAGRYAGPYPTVSPLAAPLLSQTFVYPNPASDWARLHYHLGQDVETLSVLVLNARGEIVAEEDLLTGLDPGDHHWDWDIGDVARGVYYILLDARGAGESRRAVVRAAILGGGK